MFAKGSSCRLSQLHLWLSSFSILAMNSENQTYMKQRPVLKKKNMPYMGCARVGATDCNSTLHKIAETCVCAARVNHISSTQQLGNNCSGLFLIILAGFCFVSHQFAAQMPWQQHLHLCWLKPGKHMTYLPKATVRIVGTFSPGD